MSRTEITIGQFEDFVQDANYRSESQRSKRGGRGYNAAKRRFDHAKAFNWKNNGLKQTDDHPVVNVTWHDAGAFCEWLSKKEGIAYRLPTEAEWEYACRAGASTRYSFGDDAGLLAEHANVADQSLRADTRISVGRPILPIDDGHASGAKVGSFTPNAFGMYDMHGNVWEWCRDVSTPKLSGGRDPIAQGQGIARIIRGGSWFWGAGPCRCGLRNWCEPSDQYWDVGFRIVAIPTTKTTAGQGPESGREVKQ